MRRFAGRAKAELVLAEHETAPQTWEAPLAAELARRAPMLTLTWWRQRRR